MKKIILMLCMIIFVLSLSACSEVNSVENTLVQMKIVDKQLDDTYIDGCDDKYNIKLEYNNSVYVIKDENLYRNTKIGDCIDVRYTTEYDKYDNIINVKVKAVNK